MAEDSSRFACARTRAGERGGAVRTVKKWLAMAAPTPFTGGRGRHGRSVYTTVHGFLLDRPALIINVTLVPVLSLLPATDIN